MYLEIRDQKHLMVAEGSADEKPTEHKIMEAISAEGFEASNISMFYDTLQRFWRYTADIKKI